MASASLDARSFWSGADIRWGRLVPVFLLSQAMIGFALSPESGVSSTWVLSAGLCLLLVCLALVVTEVSRAMTARRMATMVAGVFRNDATPSFFADEDGAVLSVNPAALSSFEETSCETLAGTLRSALADPATALFRLQNVALDKGSAKEDVLTRDGPLRLSVQTMPGHTFLWRIEKTPNFGASKRSGDAMPFPVVRIEHSGAIGWMNAQARELIGRQVTSADSLFVGLPMRAGCSNLIATKSGTRRFQVFEIDVGDDSKELLLVPNNETQDPGLQGFDLLPVALLQLDTEGQILRANATAVALLGDTAIPGASLGDLMEGLGRPTRDWLEEASGQKCVAKSEFLKLKQSDRDAFVQVTLSATTKNETDYLIAVLSDATELKSLEAQFVQSQKMQAIGQLAGGVAHDFNNLLTAISGHCDLLLLRHDQSDEEYADLMQIHQNANRAASLVGQLLAFSRKQTLQPEVLDVRDTLSDLTHLLNRLVGEKVSLTLSHDPVLGAIWADKRQLEQVLMNLVVNARDAMPDGGEICIVTEALTLDQSLKRDRVVLPPGDYVVLKVIDQGVGIPSEELQKVFEPFFTTKRIGEGTGLGLSTAYGIVKQTGGYIFVDSVVGSGTSFSVIFPVRQRTEEDHTPAETATPSSTSGHGEGVVLLVEDEAPVRAFASRALRLRGYTVIEAESAEEALRLLEDATLIVDVFVTDVVMPGLDGPTWVSQALKTRPNVQVVFVSGYAEGALGETSPSIANSAFLQKPFSLSQLTQTVHERLT